MSREGKHEDDRKTREESGYTPDGGGGHVAGGGKREHGNEKKQAMGKPSKPSPRRGPMKAER
jgi:hypothetical protein